ncbi:MAG: co-chaperone GroES [Clostridiales bacterium]|nr:co-chaperone GroES [Clostridiales bacterium]
MKLHPLGDRVVLKMLEAEEKTQSGIILTAQSQERPMEALVVEVGPGGVDAEGNQIDMQVKKGDKVLYSKLLNTVVKYDGEEYVILRQSDILAIVED